MKNVLVTGANGQLGNEIKQISNKNNEFNFIFTDVEDLDITNLEEVELFFQNNKINYVVNCAAYTNVDGAEKEKDLSEKINVTGVKNLAICSEKHSAHIIHISTDYVYGGKKTTPYFENDKTNPQSAYGLTKLEGENAILKNTNYTIIRTAWLYSKFGKNFVKTMLNLAENRDEISVVFDQVGTPTNAADLAEAIIQIINKLNKNNEEYPNGIYNYSNEGVCSWYDFAKAIMQINNKNCKVLPIESKQFPTPAKRPEFSVLNKSKIKDTFNIEIPHWQESLTKYFLQYKTHL